MVVYLRAKFEVSSIILTGFRRGRGSFTPPPPPPRQNEPIKSPPRLGLKAPLRIKIYRNYKTFDEYRFNEDVKSKLDSIEKLDYPLFESIFIDVLNTCSSNN